MMNPADELASVRVQIARLRAQERVLREALIADERGRTGRWTLAEVVETEMRLFDHRLLPELIREDPMFWRTRPVVDVVCHDIAERAGAARRLVVQAGVQTVNGPLQ